MKKESRREEKKNPNELATVFLAKRTEFSLLSIDDDSSRYIDVYTVNAARHTIHICVYKIKYISIGCLFRSIHMAI